MKSNLGVMATTTLAVVRTFLSASILVSVGGCAPDEADGLAEEAAAATVDIYTRMTAKDAAGFLRYRPDGGFSEFTPSSKELERLDLGFFVDFFNSDNQVNLRAVDVEAQAFGDVAVVTATRVGYIAAPDVSNPVEARYALTMVWSKIDGELKLRHLHYSPLPSSR
ncbi:uncharacterized protein SOCE26_002270 [Sorangium cellulosum]|uniref:SnoaL-like domain-containing protein n=1 Tax=Sorangium cellulosum TaxID=56 RepID=A0A2L0EHT7_SORCE|nr:nuclear transport factor 2 family protein [Sorangium cellulosum]AUX38847.1 uncharacterized protein SOCE26_002270 [Sorangium cellulosum]